MSELKITANSLENAILKDGNFVFGVASHTDSSITVSGDGAQANGKAIHGGYILANGDGAHAEGYAGSIGNFILAIGDGAHAEGYADSTGPIKASGNGAHAEGQSTTASGIASHAGGIGTIANYEAMTAIGKYNNTSINAYFVVGNGTNNNRKDAFVVDTEGNVQIGGNITKVGNISIGDTATAKVNNVPDVYLGCPIGTVVMWAGGANTTNTWKVSTEAPDGWLVCDGRVIPTENASYNKVSSDYEDFQNLLDVIGTKYGTIYNSGSLLYQPHTVKNESFQYNVYYVCIPDFTQKFPLGAGYTNTNTNSSETLGKNYFKFSAGNETYYSNNGSTGGEAGHILTPDEMPSHQHNLNNLDGGEQDLIYPVGGTSRGENYHRGIDLNSGTNHTYDDVSAIFMRSNSNNTSTIESVMTSVGENKAHNNIPPYLAINFIIKYK